MSSSVYKILIRSADIIEIGILISMIFKEIQKVRNKDCKWCS